MTAPSGTTPWVANRHKAISSFRANAITITLRMRAPVPPTVTGASEPPSGTGW